MLSGLLFRSLICQTLAFLQQCTSTLHDVAQCFRHRRMPTRSISAAAYDETWNKSAGETPKKQRSSLKHPSASDTLQRRSEGNIRFRESFNLLDTLPVLPQRGPEQGLYNSPQNRVDNTLLRYLGQSTIHVPRM